MAVFPQLGANGMITQRPYTKTASHRTTFKDQPTGRRHSWYWRDDPLYRFEVNYSAITLPELDTLMSFFNDRKGRLGEFTFIDPSGNMIPSTTAYETGTADPFGGTRAMTGSVIGPVQVLPDTHEIQGYVLSGSVWAKSSSPGNTIDLAFSACDPSIVQVKIPNTTGWVRYHMTTTVISSYQILFSVGGSGTALFGPMVAATKGPGEYFSSPAHYAVHSKCRFDTDDLDVRYTAPNQYGIVVPIVEYL